MAESEPRETFGHFIDVTLTEAEISEKLNRNADIDRQILTISAEKAEANQGFNNDLKLLRKEQVTLLEAAQAGKAKLEVQCYNDRDDRRGMMLIRRVDGGEIVDERALTAEERGIAADERQGSLFDGQEKKPAGPAADAPPPEDDDEGPSDPDLESTLDEYMADEKAAAGSRVEDNEEPFAH